MKKTWNEPKILVQQFVPNEYVAACGDENKVYNFECDAGDGIYGGVWVESNGIPGLQTSRTHNSSGWGWIEADNRISRSNSSYHACGEKHEASTTDDFLDGYYVPYGTANATSVIIWTDNGTNVHCTTNLDMDSWTTAKS